MLVVCATVAQLQATFAGPYNQLHAVFHGNRPKLSLVDQYCHQPSNFKINQRSMSFRCMAWFCIVLQVSRWVVLQLGALKLFDVCEYYAHNC